MSVASGDLVIRVTAMPTDLNPYGGVFGGWLMCQLALGASSLVTRRTGRKAIVVAANDFAFPAAMAVGDELSVYADVVRTGRTSMTVRATGFGRQRAGESQDEVARGEFIFVVVDENDRPTPIAA